jgi:hypothetical protein
MWNGLAQKRGHGLRSPATQADYALVQPRLRIQAGP